MRKCVKYPYIFALLSLALFVSCKNEFLPVPEGKKVETSINASPENFTVSHGRQKIYLSWNSVAGAVYYCVYASDSLTPVEESFSRAAYVTPADSGVLSCEIDVAPGAESYYRVTAVLANKSETVPCAALRATSLAVPEITAIETDSLEASCLSVYWNMSNCRNDTYRKQTEYDIICTDFLDSSKFYKYTVKAEDLAENVYTLTGLSPHSTYKIKVCARTELGDTTESLELSAETLHRMQPASPVNLEASCGISKDGITLRFTLPEKADVKLREDGSFEKVPLRFDIYRKPRESDDWEKTVENAQLNQLNLEDDTLLTPENYPEEGGITVTYSDTGVSSRGVVYDYRVQSYIDLETFKTRKGINDAELKKLYEFIETSETVSASQTFGWSLAPANISCVNSSIKSEDGTKFERSSAGLSFEWKNFLYENQHENEELSKQFKFLLYEKFSHFDCDAEVENYERKFVCAFDSAEKINSYMRVFDLEKEQKERGIYDYTIYIVNADFLVPASGDINEPAEYYDEAETLSSVFITDNVKEIEGFEVTGGYSNKFEITWKAEKNVKYTLTYSQTEDGVTVLNKPVEGYDAFELDEGLEENTVTVTCSHEFNPLEFSKDGITRTYYLTASATQAGFAPSTDSKTAVSLGIPSPVFELKNVDYDSVTVTWKKLSQAKKYKISIFENDENDVEIITNDGEVDGVNVVETADELDNVYYSYKFDSSQIGESYYKNALTAGSDFKCTVKAFSDLDSTEESINVRTMGPSSLQTVTSVAKLYNSINVEWNSVEGAKCFQVLRRRYKAEGKDASGKTNWVKDSDWEAFVVNASSLEVSANGEAYEAMSVRLNEDGSRFILTDTYQKITAEQPGQSDVTQSRIPWGIPIEYAVFPLLSEKDEFDGEKLVSQEVNGSIIYDDIRSLYKKGSAIGYGLNVTAGKADSSQYIKISWDTPYIQDENVQPVIYKRAKNSMQSYTGSDSIQGTGLSRDSSEYPYVIGTENERVKACEYAVKYIANGNADLTLAAAQNEPFVASYTDFLKEKLDSNGEPLAVGYLFYLPGFSVNNVLKPGTLEEGFKEAVNYTPWNYEERKNGPQDVDGKAAYTVWTKNKNNAEGWFKIASINQNGVISITQGPDWYDTDIQPSVTGLTLAPNNVNDESGATDGLLKVQRDYKHYYMIQAQRKVEDKIIYTYIGLDESVWTYRRISGEELSKAAMLTVADLVNTHVKDHDTGTGTLGTGATEWQIGNESSTPRFGWAQDFRSRFWWFIKEYNQTYTELPGGTYTSDNPFKTFIKVSDENSNSVFRGKRSSSSLMHLSAEESAGWLSAPGFNINKRIPLIVEPYAINGPCVTYGGTVNFAVSSNDIAITLKRDNTTVFEKTVNGREESRYWCPINLDDRGYNGHDDKYRWWLVHDGGTKTEDFVWEEE